MFTIFQATDTSLRQAVSLSSWLQSGHLKMRISEMPPAGTIEISCISAVQRQSGSSVEPATSRRSNFDMTPPIPVGKRVYQLGFYGDMRPRNAGRVAEVGPWITTSPPVQQPR